MDSNIILNWSIIISTILFLIAFTKRKNKKKENKIFSVLQSFANENNCTISNYDHLKKTLIGIDKGSKNLFFIRTMNNKENRTIIDLSEVIKCRMINSERTTTFDNEKVKVIDKIMLVFSFIDKRKEDVSLEFYNNNYDQLTISGELQLAQKWLGIIESILIANSEVSKVNLQSAPDINKPVTAQQTAAYDSKQRTKFTKYAI